MEGEKIAALAKKHDLPLVVDYVRETLGHYAGQVEALHDFAAWFDAALLPAIAQRTWDASP